MMRTNYIDMMALDMDFLRSNDENQHWTAERVQSRIFRQKPVDVVPVVRCKDCKFYQPGMTVVVHCKNYYGLSSPVDDDFCPYGRRKDLKGEKADD